MNQLTLTWMGHSCFQVSLNGYTVVFDPYEDHSVPGLRPLDVSAHQIFCSHNHHDHNATQIVRLLPKMESPFHVTTLSTFHDLEQGRLRGENTIHILEGGGFRLAHFGDLGCPLVPGQLQFLGQLDVALLPIGGFYTIDPMQAKKLIDDLQPRVVIPMHYRSSSFGFDVLATVEEFLSLTGGGVSIPSNTLSIKNDMPSQIAVLSYL